MAACGIGSPDPCPPWSYHPGREQGIRALAEWPWRSGLSARGASSATLRLLEAALMDGAKGLPSSMADARVHPWTVSHNVRRTACRPAKTSLLEPRYRSSRLARAGSGRGVHREYIDRELIAQTTTGDTPARRSAVAARLCRQCLRGWWSVCLDRGLAPRCRMGSTFELRRASRSRAGLSWKRGDKVMPRKVRDLIRDLRKVGFENRGGKGSHRNFVHPKASKPVTLSGHEGNDARSYQERAVRLGIEEVSDD
jgi:predicted RNA binding protein YcfA (HicA-like mRNA interferase family)